MRVLLTVMVISSVALSGCSRLQESRLNPGNWFGKSKSTQSAQPRTQTTAEANPLIPETSSVFRRDKTEVYLGTPVDQVTALSVEPTTSGAIVRVTAMALQQGAFDVRLTTQTDGKPVNGVLTFRLLALQPTDTPQGSPRQRTLHAARFIPNTILDDTRTIRVIAARNERSTTR